jgi:1,3-beta-glucan synthase
VGLVSRLSSPGGGFDEISYPEFCRSAFDSAGMPVRDAVVEMERRYGKVCLQETFRR